MSIICCSQGHENPGTNNFCQVCGGKLSPPAVNNLVSGAILEGRYRLVQQIGQGGFGRTYLCEDLNRFNEPCVLKEFAPQVHGVPALNKAKDLFEREANVLYKLQHPQIPKFRELFQMTSGAGGLFLVQDYVAGHTYRYALGSRLQQNQTFREDEVRQLLINLLPVLEYTHSLGVIHRDIAPDNLIMRSSDGMPVLIDFGGVKLIAVNAEMQATGNTEPLTRLGKVGYAPPEQMQRGTVFPHSDLYALAATCLVLLSGEEPIELIDPRTMNWQWRQAIKLESDLGEVLDRMLQSKPNDRIPSATEVLKALQPSAISLPVATPTTVGTVVVSPPLQNMPVSSSQITNISGSGFWHILSRTWIGILGIGAAIGLGWGATSVLKQPQPSPTTIGTESSPIPTDSPSPVSSEPTVNPETSKPAVASSESPSVESSPRSRRLRSRRLKSRNESPPVSTPQPTQSASSKPAIIESPSPSPSQSPSSGVSNPDAGSGDSLESTPKPSVPTLKPEPSAITPAPEPSSTDLNGNAEVSPKVTKPKASSLF
jgi:serine/threonine protein kinase, bacterial